jgi:K+-sensing histidine kinase KdpD
VAVARRPGVNIIRVKTTAQQAADRVATVLGPVLVIVVAWATDTVGSDMSIANAALVLAFVCVAAALVSPIAGFVTSAAAALALNYFHTTPVHSLRMTEADEVSRSSCWSCWGHRSASPRR